jgi:hypothetical protein
MTRQLGRRRTTIGSLIALTLALVIAGCEEEADRFKPKGIDTAKTIAAVKSLDHKKFEALSYYEKDHFLTILTKLRGMGYLTAPSEMTPVVPGQPQYGKELFQLHDTDSVLAFLKEELNRRLDGAAQRMKSLDDADKQRESRLIFRLATDYLQLLYVKHYGEEFRAQAARIGREAQVPYQRLDERLVGPLDKGAVQLYVRAALAGDSAAMQEARAQIDHVYALVEEDRVDSEYPFPQPDRWGWARGFMQNFAREALRQAATRPSGADSPK